MSHNRIRTGQGKIEYLAHKEEIEKLLHDGYTIMLIYEKMKKDNKISMAYKTLCAFLGSNMNKKNSKKEQISHTKQIAIEANSPTNEQSIAPQEEEKRALKEPEPRFGEVKKPFKEKF